MKIFISWSGQQSNHLALAIRDWLQLILPYVKPWMSDRDIDAGTGWGGQLRDGLADADFGIICVTPENITAPWLLFEAGAVWKATDATLVVPLLYQVELSEVTGPLSQFQSKKLGVAAMRDILQSIQKQAAVPEPEANWVKRFDAMWPDLAEAIEQIPEIDTATPPRRSTSVVLESLIAEVRELRSEVRNSSVSRRNAVQLTEAAWEGFLSRNRPIRDPEELASILETFGKVLAPVSLEGALLIKRTCTTLRNDPENATRDLVALNAFLRSDEFKATRGSKIREVTNPELFIGAIERMKAEIEVYFSRDKDA